MIGIFCVLIGILGLTVGSHTGVGLIFGIISLCIGLAALYFGNFLGWSIAFDKGKGTFTLYRHYLFGEKAEEFKIGSISSLRLSSSGGYRGGAIYQKILEIKMKEKGGKISVGDMALQVTTDKSIRGRLMDFIGRKWEADEDD